MGEGFGEREAEAPGVAGFCVVIDEWNCVVTGIAPPARTKRGGGRARRAKQSKTMLLLVFWASDLLFSMSGSFGEL
jgi:hypothetical protein